MKKKYSRPTLKVVRDAPTPVLQFAVTSYGTLEKKDYGSTEE